MIVFTTFEEADKVDARSAELHTAAMIAEGYDGETNINPRTGKPYPRYWAERYSGVTEQDGLFLLPDHPYHRQSAAELNIQFTETP